MTATDRNRVMLNLGAGLQYRDGWTNYDRSRVVELLGWRPGVQTPVRLASRLGMPSINDGLELPKTTQSRELTEAVPHLDGSVDVIYTSHFLEQRQYGSRKPPFPRCHRVLKADGVLRVVVPDVRRLAERYWAGERELFGDHDGPIADSFVQACHFRPEPRGQRLERALRRLARTGDPGQRWMYYGESMTSRLVAAGFSHVEVVEYQYSRDASAGRLDRVSAGSVHSEGRKKLLRRDEARTLPASAPRAPAGEPTGRVIGLGREWQSSHGLRPSASVRGALGE